MTKKVLVLGASGLVGSRFVELSSNYFDLLTPSHQDLDLLNFEDLNAYIAEKAPDAILNCVAYTNVDTAELEREDKQGLSYQLNSGLVEALVKAASEHSAYLLQVSTDFVFDGKKGSPYTEDDIPNPINWYGQTKLIGEKFVHQEPSFGIARIQMPYRANFIKEDGTEGKKDFARFFYGNLSLDKPIKVVTNQIISPVFVDDAIRAFQVLIDRKERGVFHIASTNQITPLGFACEMAKQMHVSQELIQETTLDHLYQGKAPRPKNCALNTRKFETLSEGVLHSTTEGIKSFLQQVS
ncbi:hypothetical protein A2631_03055 [Candidatus Daviesbacteria bacterium RIFCSPHIGHO2_01_FULL_44_29]|uniref:dTDP-4-dehydrorhamnose reductase n=1 Tax=Candidatus Daviesbacteria bacterium RIFCSPHIGHO2_02_FULL_43_12 TaxID=1797776 RepID=A0A1F5KKE0_9BACT|nr:MAG: hypothetical protein A2631_03055 [Candidatus Daviesbacteria bacterium RIFCSPHIGHO2_01_FULL_44_29]OGE40785.1 MAG: hypothetical protein A3E86_02290 [Candidatus Daviesbacteria bacterium RIFCSPHIGHO2_12_FULL_47_45]OGE41362.1 MAG: hypothetical protein A3D25_02450 [Candidatus Daviesbacteria bacterium RIFCSPHIGHO2_02_FULL_43_12]OGE69563.1 MAG: hypothetical protein A3B55_04195 [Candidatus Daviesbacteria bacterium RIFCSPLOWO2_01_FULL_43_15]